MDRVFDTQTNGFTLQQAAVTIADQPTTGLGGVLNLVVGNDANVTEDYLLNHNNYYDVLQVFLQYATENFTVMGGKI